MQPETQANNLNPEHQVVQSMPSVERSLTDSSVELSPERTGEPYEQKSEINAIMADVNLTTALPTPVAATPILTNDTSIISNPPVASDDDLIEKEWVDKAKKIVADTQNNPHQRDEEVNKLQIDYIKKRFGRELGVAE